MIQYRECNTHGQHFHHRHESLFSEAATCVETITIIEKQMKRNQSCAGSLTWWEASKCCGAEFLKIWRTQARRGIPTLSCGKAIQVAQVLIAALESLSSAYIS